MKSFVDYCVTLERRSVCVSQDPAGIFELVEVVGNGTYGQVYKVRTVTSELQENCGGREDCGELL